MTHHYLVKYRLSDISQIGILGKKKQVQSFMCHQMHTWCDIKLQMKVNSLNRFQQVFGKLQIMKRFPCAIKMEMVSLVFFTLSNELFNPLLKDVMTDEKSQSFTCIHLHSPLSRNLLGRGYEIDTGSTVTQLQKKIPFQSFVLFLLNTYQARWICTHIVVSHESPSFLSSSDCSRNQRKLKTWDMTTFHFFSGALTSWWNYQCVRKSIYIKLFSCCCCAEKLIIEFIVFDL